MSSIDSDLTTLHRRFVVWEATAILRHDLRNKLASVRNASFYLRRKVERQAADLLASDPRVATFFDLSSQELDAAEAILGERLPKLPDVVAAGFDVDRAIAGALAHVRAPVKTIASGLVARGDHAELAVAVLCLVENAVDAGAGAIEVTVGAEDDSVVISVRDDGPALDPDVARRAPEPFFTTRDGHLGLGLPIVKRIAGRADGELRFDGRFAIAVPRA
jgi:signal transduction histidine kinase